MSTALDSIYSAKQQEVLDFAMNNDYFMLINHGAKRSGKTIIDNDLFLYEVRRAKRFAKRDGVSNPQYILAGATLGSIQKNILIELENKYGLSFYFDKYNRFKLFGVTIVMIGHSTIANLKAARGFTAYGAYVNEASLAHEEVFNEIKSRCSAEHARIICDTNPDQPEHFLMRDYIKKQTSAIKAFHFRLTDNTFLTKRYMDNIRATTPSGVFYDRDINGLWVSADGVVYKDFREDVHYISEEELAKVKMVSYFGCVDWGFSHYGVILVIGESDDGKFYIVEEVAKQFEEIDYWVKEGKRLKEQYHIRSWYADSARSEHVIRFRREGLRTFNADKAVIPGIEAVARLYKTKRLFIVKERVHRFRDEIFMYVWNDKTGDPVKEFDDVMDSIRYGIYTRYKKKIITGKF
jgi:PBSX family phage terminase large subunit